MSLPEPVLHRTGEGPPVLLLHPLGGDRSFWDGVGLDGFELLTYDFPGHGGTPVPEAPYTVEDLADQAVTLLERAGYGPVDVVGVSLGGLVAQRLAGVRPDLVRRLVVVDAVAVYPEAMRSMWRERAASAPVTGLEPLVEPTLALWFTAERLATGADAVDRFRRSFLAGDPRGYAQACAALAEADVTGVLDRITAPALVVCGEDDAPPFTAAATELAARLSGARLVWLSPARHAGVLEQPEQFRAAVRAFLADEPVAVPR